MGSDIIIDVHSKPMTILPKLSGYLDTNTMGGTVILSITRDGSTISRGNDRALAGLSVGLRSGWCPQFFNGGEALWTNKS